MSHGTFGPEAERDDFNPDDQAEPTLAAMTAADESLRAACHAAYDAPHDPHALYARNAELVSLLSKVEQLARHLAEAAAKLAQAPAGLYSDVGATPAEHAASAATALLLTAESVDLAGKRANNAWSALAHIGVRE